MRAVADALRLPLPASCVDAVISNPPYPGNGVWERDYWAGVGASVGECQRVLKDKGRGWFLVRNPQGGEQWMTFNKAFCRWAHPGYATRPVPGPGITWGSVPDDQVAPLILRWSPPGGTVLDPFAGQGCIPKLARRLGRIALGVDIDANQLEDGGPYAQEDAPGARASGQKEGSDRRAEGSLRLRLATEGKGEEVMADADKTTATEGLEALPDAFATPSTIAQKNANGGWNKKDLPQGASRGTGPGKNISGNED